MSPTTSSTPEASRRDGAGGPALTAWGGGIGGALLIGGGWVASRSLARIGPELLVALLLAALGAGLVIAAAVLAVLAPGGARDDVRKLGHTLDAMAAGDLTREPHAADPAGGLAPVASSLRSALAYLRRVLGIARGAAHETAQRAEELGTQCSAAHVAAQRSAELGAHVAEQASVAAETARSTHGELTRLALDVAALEGQLRQRSDAWTRAERQSGSAAGELDDAMRSLDQLTARFDAATIELSGLGRSVDDVREFVALVRKMARQSKLLSLNAAMEAARAGEQGSGFGVVASEVRRLAKSSAEAADRTETLLGDLLSRAGVALDSARESLTLARSTRDAVDRSRHGLSALAAELRSDASEQDEDPGSAAPAAALGAAIARVEHLAGDLAALAQGARDTRLAGGAQVARAQDLIAAAHSLGRSAARAAGALQDLRVEAAPSAGTAPEVPASPATPVPA